jgi:glycerol uptake facilitator-like aquaporin
MIASGSYGGWWISLAGPIAGGIVAAVLYNTFVRKGEPVAVEQ